MQSKPGKGCHFHKNWSNQRCHVETVGDTFLPEIYPRSPLPFLDWHSETGQCLLVCFFSTHYCNNIVSSCNIFVAVENILPDLATFFLPGDIVLAALDVVCLLLAAAGDLPMMLIEDRFPLSFIKSLISSWKIIDVIHRKPGFFAGCCKNNMALEEWHLALRNDHSRALFSNHNEI